MKITNETANQLEKGQLIKSTEMVFISTKGVMVEEKEIQILEIVSIRKNKKAKCGLRVTIKVTKGNAPGSGYIIIDFEGLKTRNKFEILQGKNVK